MRGLIFSLLILVCGSFSGCSLSFGAVGAAEEIFHEGNIRYAEGDFEEALERYRAALEVGSSSNLLFNAGLAAFEAGDYGSARLYWERALRIEPRHSGARESLALLIGLHDLAGGDDLKGEEIGSYYRRMIVGVTKTLSFNQVRWLLTICGWAVGFTVIFYRRLGSKKIVGLGVALLLIFGILLSAVAEFRRLDRRAVILSDEVALQVAPVTESPEIGRLRSGDAVEIIDEYADYYRVRLDDEVEGYLGKEVIGRVVVR